MAAGLPGRSIHHAAAPAGEEEMGVAGGVLRCGLGASGFRYAVAVECLARQTMPTKEKATRAACVNALGDKKRSIYIS